MTSRSSPAFAVLAGLVLAGLFGACSSPSLLLDRVGTRDIPSAWKDEPVVCLLDSQELAFISTREGNGLNVNRMVAYRVNKINPPLLQSLEFYDLDSIQDPVEASVEVHYPDGKIEYSESQRWPRSDVELSGFYETGMHFRTFQPSRYLPGMVLVFREKNFYRQALFKENIYLRTGYPTLMRSVRFTAPANAGIKVALRNPENLRLESSRGDSDSTVLQVSGHYLPKMDLAVGPERPEEWYAGLHFSLPPKGSQPAGWKDLGEYYLSLIADNMIPNDSVKLAASRLQGDDEDSLIQQAFNLMVHNVRYLANEAEMYGWIPRPPGYTLENGLGDCKEMANLLRALLREKGLNAGLALVFSGPGFQALKEFPTLDNFNHAITYVKMKDGTLRFLDPTFTFSNAATSYLHLVGQKALVLEPGASRFVEIPLFPGDANRIQTTSTLFGPDENGTYTLQGETVFSGQPASEWIRSTRYASPESSRERTRSYFKTLLGAEPSFTRIEDESVADVKVSYRIDMEGKNLDIGSGGLLLSFPGICVKTVFPTQREGMVEMGPLDQEDTWILPEGFTEIRSQPMNFKGVRGTWEQNGNRISRHFSIPHLQFTPRDSSSLREFQSGLTRFSAVVWKP